MKSFICSLIFVFYIYVSEAQTLITAKNGAYANIPVRVYGYKNLLAHTSTLLAEGKFDNDGKLSIKINIKEARLVYIPIYSFKFIFYADADKKLVLKLPALSKIKKAFNKIKSYNGVEIPLYIYNENTLNNAITDYDRDYNEILKNDLQKLYKSKKPLATLQKIRSIPTNNTSQYFQNYKYYKEGYCYYLAGVKDSILVNYIKGKGASLQHTAYVSLLRKIAGALAIDFSADREYKNLYNRCLRAKTSKEITAVANELVKTKDTNFNNIFLLSVLYMGVKKQIIPIGAVRRIFNLLKSSEHYKNKNLALELSEAISKKPIVIPKFTRTVGGKDYTEDIFKTTCPTLVTFFDKATDNSESIQKLVEMQKKYHNKFKVVIFSCGNLDIDYPKEYSKEYPTEWINIPISYYDYLLMDFKLGRFPYFVLLDKNGNLYPQNWQQFFIELSKK